MQALIFALHLIVGAHLAPAETLWEQAENLAREESTEPAEDQIREEFEILAENELGDLYFGAPPETRGPITEAQHQVADKVVETLIPKERNLSEDMLARRLHNQLIAQIADPVMQDHQTIEDRLKNLGQLFGYLVARLWDAADAKDEPALGVRARQLLRVTSEALLTSDRTAWPTPTMESWVNQRSFFERLRNSTSIRVAGGLLGTFMLVDGAVEHIPQMEFGGGALVALSFASIFAREMYSPSADVSVPAPRVGESDRQFGHFLEAAGAQLAKLFTERLPNVSFERGLEFLDEHILTPPRYERACASYLREPTVN